MKMRLMPVLLLLLMPFGLSAHVKWFVDFDTTKEPESLFQILRNVAFWGMLVLSVIVIYLTSILDRKWLSPVDKAAWKPVLSEIHHAVPVLMRFGSSAFFLILSLWFSHILLTPELISDNPALKYIHGAIALTAWNRRTSFIAGLGILFLYGYAIDIFGLFHMLDYLVFAGTAIYLIMQTFRAGAEHGIELELVRFTLTYSFLWGAVEKFMQPGLFYQLLENHSYLAMGLSWPFFVMACGFVEFCCAWHIYTGRLAGYAGIGVMAFFVIAAIIPFGLIDFIGHFLFIIPLLAVLASPRKVPLFVTSAGNTLAFVVALSLYLLVAYASYYVLHYQLHPHLFS